MKSSVQDMYRFAVLGDSAAFGIGDYDINGDPRGWAHYLSSAFAGQIQYLNVSRPGAKSLEVRDIQFPKIKEFKPNICGLIVGGNDILRNDFNPNRIYVNLKSTIIELQKINSEILMLELHDPTKLLKLPKVLENILTKRVNAVNEVIYRLNEEFNIVLLKTRSLPDIYSKSLWHIDRMHPGTKGHQILALSFRDLLLSNGWKFRDIEFDQPIQMTPSEKRIWMLRNGLPWFIKRSFDLLPAIAFLISIELIGNLFTSMKSLTSRT